MVGGRRFVVTVAVLGMAAVAHAALTWPTQSILVLFGVGGCVAFFAEFVATTRGWVTHHLDPQFVGVPAYTVVGWTSIIYVAFRGMSLVANGWMAVLGTVVLTTAFDLSTDRYGVANGYWTYTDAIPGPRVLGVPWWNYLGWVLVTGVTTGVTVLVA